MENIKNKTTHSIILNIWMQACIWQYCRDIRKHYYTEKLGWPEPSASRNFFNINARKNY